ncbi:MAG: 4Fe-4S dicluster domain-containing protein, partial [Clostridia bacterium]|nr:4Fe-4S dicluster domain-containing protein [Clostridia bacterium]
MTDIKAVLAEAGIVGAGGAGFPSYAKLAEGADTLIVNCSECEPLLHTDYEIIKQHRDEVVAGAEMIADALGILRVIFAVKEHTSHGLGLTADEVLGKKTRVALLPNMYPMGDEITLIYETTGRLVPPSSLPIKVGVIVFNTETVYNLYRAATLGEPVTEKWLTVAGDIPDNRAFVVRVPIGMRVSDLFDALQVSVPATHRLLVGGPSMGRVANLSTEVITKTTKGLLILPADIPAVATKIASFAVQKRRASSACCQCTRCTDMCPRQLLGYPLEPHRMVRSSTSLEELDPALYTEASLCCGCGICEIAACCQDISPRAVIYEMKSKLAAKKLRYTPPADATFRPDPTRPYRQMPITRWKRLLGVAPFDRRQVYTEGLPAPRAVEILMSQHIGAPSLPLVKAGDSVTRGQKIAEAAKGLSVPQFASIDGRVSY